MSNPPRSCLQCRSAKVKCDLVRPTCGRCRRRGTLCDGYHVEGSFTFRDETVRAQQLSRRSRGEAQEEASNIDPGLQPPSALEAPVVNVNSLQEHFYWLNERALAALPAQVVRDGETRAVERLFANWIVFPSEVSPGYMHHLPILYEQATSNSILHLAVRALAFADIRRHNSETREYELKGLQSYGAAITSLRNVVQDPANFKDDQVLAALLLIDTFETLHLARDKPLGLHDKALKYVLEVRGTDSLLSTRRFCLWRIALFRLQARQLLLGEDGGEDGGALQQTLLDSLNQERPDLRVMYHVSQIIHLCTRSNHLLNTSGQETSATTMAQTTGLLQEIAEFVSSIETWTSTIDDSLKPITVMSDVTARLCQLNMSDENPMDTFECPHMLEHHDVTLAFLWSFYAAAQIILRDHVIQILRLAASLSQENARQYLDRTHAEELTIDGLSSSIVRTFPKFMGFDIPKSTGVYPRLAPSQASSLGRFLGVFAMVVVKNTAATSKQHKRIAEKVLAWMHTHYQIA